MAQQYSLTINVKNGIGITLATMTFTLERSGYTQGFEPTSIITWSCAIKSSFSDWITTSSFVRIDSTNLDISSGSGTHIIKHNSDGTASFTVSMLLSGRRGNNNEHTASDSHTYVLPTLTVPATLTGALDFNDEEDPTIEYYNPSGNDVEKLYAGIATDKGALFIPYRSISKTSSSYSFYLTDDERSNLRQIIKTGNSTTVRFYLMSVIDGESYETYLTKTLTLVNYTPVLSPVVTDSNSVTVALTGNNTAFIKYFSNAYFDTGAVARKEATIKSQTITCGSQALENYTSNTGTFNNIDSDTFYFTVTDSRSNTTNVSLPLYFIHYIKLTASLHIVMTLSGELIFNVDGNYFNKSFGVQSNTLGIKFLIKKNGQALGSTVTLDPYTQGTLSFGVNTFNYEYTITGLTPIEADGSHNNYSLQVFVSDKLSNVETQELTVNATPIFEWGKDDFKFNVPVHFNRGFTSDAGLKTTSLTRTLAMNSAGQYEIGTLSELGLSSDNTIYSMTGAITHETSERIYPVPSPPLGNSTGTYTIGDSSKFWIEGDSIYITVAEPWGTASVRLVLMYF